MDDSPNIEDRLPKAPRWLQVYAGLLLAPFALLGLLGSVVMVISPPPKAPILAAVLGVIFILVCVWVLVLAFQLIFNRPSGGGLMGPWALRASSTLFLFLPLAGVFTGYYREHGAIAFGQAAIYVFVAITLWSLAKHRSRAA